MHSAAGRGGEAQLHKDGAFVDAGYHIDAGAEPTVETADQRHDTVNQARNPRQSQYHGWQKHLPSSLRLIDFDYEPQGELMQEQHRRSVQDKTSPIRDPYARELLFSEASSIDGSNLTQKPSPSAGQIGGSKRVHKGDSAPRKRHPDMSTSGPKFHSSDSSSNIVAQADPTSSASSRNSDHHQRQAFTDPTIPMVLPARKVFPIQIGDKLFRLSGASISSDFPSYFSQFFEEQMKNNEGAEHCRTLYIDRDPKTFEDISLHLQGYHVEPRDGAHFVRLYADAQFFHLPRLSAQLSASTIYVRVGEQEFRVPKALFNGPGDSPNYFSLGFTSFFATPEDTFPGLTQRSLIRPPSLLPPSIPARSSRVFADLLHLLQGYELHIQNEEHRAELLRDARYYHFKGLEQRLIPHHISFNVERGTNEILLKLEHIQNNGVAFVPDALTYRFDGNDTCTPAAASQNLPGSGWIHYQRPFIDHDLYSLIVEVSREASMTLEILPATSRTADFCMARGTCHNDSEARLADLLSAIAGKMCPREAQPNGQYTKESSVRSNGTSSKTGSECFDHGFKVRIGSDANVLVDGREFAFDGDADVEEMDVDDVHGTWLHAPPRKKGWRSGPQRAAVWMVSRALWRVKVQSGKDGLEVVFCAVKIEAHSNERALNAARGYLA